MPSTHASDGKQEAVFPTFAAVTLSSTTSQPTGFQVRAKWLHPFKLLGGLDKEPGGSTVGFRAGKTSLIRGGLAGSRGCDQGLLGSIT